MDNNLIGTFNQFEKSTYPFPKNAGKMMKLSISGWQNRSGWRASQEKSTPRGSGTKLKMPKPLPNHHKNTLSVGGGLEFRTRPAGDGKVLAQHVLLQRGRGEVRLQLLAPAAQLGLCLPQGVGLAVQLGPWPPGSTRRGEAYTPEGGQQPAWTLGGGNSKQI